MKNILEKSIKKLNYKGEGTNVGIRISEYNEAMDVLEELSRFNFLKIQIDQLKQLSNIYYSRLPNIIVDQKTYNKFAELINIIKMKCESVIEAISEAIPNQNENSISIKIPDINSLSELTKITKDLDTILNQSLINKYFEAKVEIQNFDSGTNWIEVIVGTGVALNFVAGLTWSAAVIRKKLLEGDMLKQQVTSYKIQNDALQAIENGLEEEIELLCDREAKSLIDENNIKDPNPEFIKRVQHSIKLLAGLLKKGAEVHSALNAPEEAKNLFPDYAKLSNIHSKIKELPKSKEDE